MYITRTKFSFEAQRKALKSCSGQNAKCDDPVAEHSVSGDGEGKSPNSEVKGLVLHTPYPFVLRLQKPALLNIGPCLQANLQPF